ncbi:C45 family autoproteolytic acyltransferase/hydrolase [Lutimaribacter marinistellae]|uniref:C45 family autoproteolytic acyltransferase/hydrolase n=1 Tax=Lutimaribacter marinistellae TaxID=1820329 RepID=A0ABV7TCY5_9RHOB
MHVVDCFGPPAARGHAHGETLRAEIAEALAQWEAATMSALGRTDFDAYCEGFLAATSCLDHAEKTVPDLHTELQGIADGAGQPFARVAAYNLMDEQWWYDTAETVPPGCSLVAIPTERGHVLAQNMDLPAHMHGSQVALRLGGPDMPEIVALSSAGLIGLLGLNDAGLAVGVNTLLMLHHDAGGLPVAFALRHALAARSRDDAANRLASARHASGQHYALVSRDGITSLECSAGGCARYESGETLLHTNHPLASRDTDANAQARLESAGFNASSHRRLDWLQAHATGLTGARQVQSLFDDTDAPLCMRGQVNGGSSTFASVVMELGETPAIRMRKGIAGTAEWQEIAFAATQI